VTDKEVVVPDLGGAGSVKEKEICVKVGDRIATEDSLIVVESDKATIEVPAPFGGEVAKLVISVGDSIKEGDSILSLTVDDAGDAGVNQVAANSAETESKAEQNAEILTPEQKPGLAPESEPPHVGKTSVETITVPDIGGGDAVEIIEINVAVGDVLAKEDTMVVLESDKATMEVPCSDAGSVVELLVSVGDKVSEGDAVLTLEVVSAPSPSTTETIKAVEEKPEPSQAPVDVAASKVASPSATVATASPSSAVSKPVHAGPAVRRLARELGVDLAQVNPSGHKNRILKQNVHEYIKQVITAKANAPAESGTGLPPLPVIDFTKFGAVDPQPLSRINKVSAANLHRSWVNVPHVTQFDEADITELESFRKSEAAGYKEQGVKLTLLAFMVKACAKALKAFPRFNSSLSQDGETLIFKQYFNIGIAVDTPNGLVVPVIRDADKKTVLEIAEDMGTLSAKARDKKLSPADMQGGCFSISSLGGIGGTAFTPIVNWPEVAILGLSRSQMKPVYSDGEFVPKLMLPLSLSYDHRVIDGAEAARFTRYLADQITDIRRLLF